MKIMSNVLTAIPCFYTKKQCFVTTLEFSVAPNPVMKISPSCIRMIEKAQSSECIYKYVIFRLNSMELFIFKTEKQDIKKTLFKLFFLRISKLIFPRIIVN